MSVIDISLDVLPVLDICLSTGIMSTKFSTKNGKLSVIASIHVNLLKMYEQTCLADGTVMCPSIEKALQHCIKEELYLETVSIRWVISFLIPVIRADFFFNKFCLLVFILFFLTFLKTFSSVSNSLLLFYIGQ